MTLFPHFLDTLPPDRGVRPLDVSALDRVRTPSMPPELLDFYREVGVGSFGGGLLFVETPDRVQGLLDVWLNRSPRRIPFARSAFGEIFYYRDLRDEAQQKGLSGEKPGELGDVSWVDVHFARIDIAALSVMEFFEEMLANPDNVDTILRRPLVRAATEILGPLGDHEQYDFVPALALGGSEELGSAQKVNMLVHTSILRQLV